MKTVPHPAAELTPRQQKLIVELTRTPDIQTAAKAADVGRTTAHRWLREEVFAEEMRRARSATYDEALNAMKSFTSRAAETLVNLINTEDERLRRHICNDILRHALKVRESEEIERRLLNIEKAIESRANGEP